MVRVKFLMRLQWLWISCVLFQIRLFFQLSTANTIVICTAAAAAFVRRVEAAFSSSRNVLITHHSNNNNNNNNRYDYNYYHPRNNVRNDKLMLYHGHHCQHATGIELLLAYLLLHPTFSDLETRGTNQLYENEMVHMASTNIVHVASTAVNDRNERRDSNVSDDKLYYSWNFENGQVTLPKVTRIGPNNMQLTQPVLLGSGSGGAVFAMQQQKQIEGSNHQDNYKSEGDNDALVALKVSWDRSSDSVTNECRVLQEIQRRTTQLHLPTNDSIETCLGSAPYHFTEGGTSGKNNDKSFNNGHSHRVMIALQPVMNDPLVSSVSDLEPMQQRRAIWSIVQTMIHLLSIGIVNVDVQTLISRTNGRVLFVDFTEAQILVDNNEHVSTSAKSPTTSMNQVLVSNFVSEIMAMISPHHQTGSASEAILYYLPQYPPLFATYCYDILLSQNFSESALVMLQEHSTL